MYVMKDNIILQRLGDEVVIFRLSDERFFSLDVVAAKIFDTLLEVKDTSAAIDRLAATYDVARDELAADVSVFVERCLREEFFVEIA